MSKRNATIVVDLGFGDAGKGSIVDYLARNKSVSTVVRFNGGGQAAHNVITPDGRHHTFAQFGSGTFVQGVKTHISRFSLFDPLAIEPEARHLRELGCGNVYSRFSLHEQALVVTRFQKSANRLREALRGNARHGSCGMGIGETTHDSIVRPDLKVVGADLRDPKRLARLLSEVQEMKRAEFTGLLDGIKHLPHIAEEIDILEQSSAPSEYAEAMWKISQQFPIVGDTYLKRRAEEGDLILEGAQGVLLDEWYGFHPHTTWSTTTFANALEILRDINFEGDVTRLGVVRAYQTRHGAGPFPTESKELTALIPDMHNGTGEWQGAFRLGWLDAVLTRYALEVCGGVDQIAMTNMDRFRTLSQKMMCTGYSHDDVGLISRLPVKTELTDLVFQETLTRLLEKVTPLYESIPNEDSLFFQMVEEELGVPLSIISYGPTALDKQEVPVRLPVAV